MNDYETLIAAFAARVVDFGLTAIPRDATYETWIDYVMDHNDNIDPGTQSEFELSAKPFFAALGFDPHKKYMNLTDVQLIDALYESDDQYANELHDAYFDTLHLVDVYTRA